MVIFFSVCRGCQRRPSPSASFIFLVGKYWRHPGGSHRVCKASLLPPHLTVSVSLSTAPPLLTSRTDDWILFLLHQWEQATVASIWSGEHIVAESGVSALEQETVSSFGWESADRQKPRRSLLFVFPADWNYLWRRGVVHGRGVFCAQADNSQYIGLWLEALNSVLLKAADACLDCNYRLSTIPFSAVNNFRQTPAHRHSGNEVFILIS